MSKQIIEQERQIKTGIIDAFQEFYYQHKKNRMYAFVLEVDESFAIQSFLTSTETSIFNETENKQQYLLEGDKWSFQLWKYRKKNNANSYSDEEDARQDDLIAKIFEDVFPEQTRHDQLNLLIENYKQAILYLTKIYSLDFNRILFLIYSPTQKNLILDYAQQLNPSSSLLFEFLAQTRISETSQNAQPIKLDQIDKDLLIDLAQLVNFIEPYDSLTVAHQAYLLTLTPEFPNLHTHIQDLVQNIAAMSDPMLSLDRTEILDRINYLYKI